jgi:hypothetical protein
LEENTHTFRIEPGPSERLHLFLPGRRYADETLSLRGTFTDRFRNVPPTGPIDADLEFWLDNGTERIPLGSPAGRLRARHRFEIELPELHPGVFRAVACRTGTTKVVARSNPLQVVEERAGVDRIFWGEIHGHTGMSDGLGDYSELYRHAREEGCLDFAAAADHACYHSDNEWLWMQDVTNSWNQPGTFVTLIGYEWAGQQVHRNIYTSRDRLKLFRGMYPPTRSLEDVYPHFHGDAEVVAGPHAPMAHGIKWEFHDPEVERFVEIYSMWGASDTRDNKALMTVTGRGGKGTPVVELLRKGARLGFTGGGDCHEGRAGFSCEDPEGQGKTSHTFARNLVYRCGMTAAVMPSLDRTALLRALRARQTYATTGARMLLDFSAAGRPMGSVGKGKSVECRARIHGVARIQKVEVLKDGEVAHTERPGSLDAMMDWVDPETPVREHFYFLRVTQEDGQMAWSSPVWISPEREAP